MDKIILPSRINYIGIFLCFDCRMGCPYCINHYGNFKYRKAVSGKEWVDILTPIQTREDLALTLCGGEPSEHPDFYYIANELHKQGKHLDCLTNGQFNLKEFCKKISPDIFKRNAPYASLRFSFHSKMNTEWLVLRVAELKRRGYSVGIWYLDSPDMKLRNERLKKTCKQIGIDCRAKEYLDATHGSYRYPDAVTGIKHKTVKCSMSEILFAPNGKVYPCHYYLYSDTRPSSIIKEGLSYKSVLCKKYGLCSPCDIKQKFDRFQRKGHCAVTIKEIE